MKICGSSPTRFVLLPPTTLSADLVQKHFPSPAKGPGTGGGRSAGAENPLVENPALAKVVLSPEKGVGARRLSAKC